MHKLKTIKHYLTMGNNMKTFEQKNKIKKKHEKNVNDCLILIQLIYPPTFETLVY